MQDDLFGQIFRFLFSLFGYHCIPSAEWALYTLTLTRIEMKIRRKQANVFICFIQSVGNSKTLEEMFHIHSFCPDNAVMIEHSSNKNKDHCHSLPGSTEIVPKHTIGFFSLATQKGKQTKEKNDPQGIDP